MAGRLTRSDSRESVFSNASCVSGIGEWQIGDRVRLDNKIGTLAYVGHTKFAPGEWIGVILENPEGKNNGTVQGVAYFKCDDNHGIFCKSSKLERIAHSSAVGSPMREMSNKYTAEFGLDVGERVMVSGGKIGYLRYLGPTDFAEGIWCGVELDQPMGKNDGTVQGKGYFACKPLYGLFAPAKKTEKAPKLDTPSKIRVHHNKTSMLRAQKGSGSHESLNSIGASSVSSRLTTGTGIGPVKRSVARSMNASTNETLVKALQETIQEKDRHLEQMIHELDLERNEIAEVTARCEELERRVASGEGGGTVDDDKLRRMDKLENERKTMKISLIDKEKIIEDLQFRLEEEEVMRQERESITKELEDKLAKINTIEAVNTFDSVSMEEKNAEIMVIREELVNVKAYRDKLEEEKIRSENMIHDMRTTLEETEERMKKMEVDFEKVMNELEEESMKSVSAMKELSEEKRKGEQLQCDVKLMEKERDESRKEIEAMKTTMESMKTATCSSCVHLKSGKEELELRLERTKREMDDAGGLLMREKEELEKQLKEVTSEMEKAMAEKEKEMGVVSQSLHDAHILRKDLEKELEGGTAIVHDLRAELERLQSTCASLESQLIANASIAEKRMEELEKLKSAHAESVSAHEKEKKSGEALKEEFDQLEKEMAKKATEMQSLSDNVTDLLSKRDGERKENEDIKKIMSELEEKIVKKEEENIIAKEAMREKIAALSEMEATVDSLRKEIGEQKTVIDRASSESDERQTRVAELLSENNKLKDCMEGVTEERDEGRKMLKEMDTKLAGAVEKKEEVRRKLETELESTRAKLGTVEETLSGKETELKAAQESLAVIHSSMEVAKMGDDERSKQLSAVKEELAKERTSSDQMKRRNEKLIAGMEEVKAQLEETKIEKKKGEETMEKELEELKREIEKISGECRMSKRREEKEKEEREKVEGEMKKIGEELIREKEVIQDIQKKKEELEKKLMETEEEKESVNTELKKEREDRGKDGMEASEWSRKYEELKEEMNTSEEKVKEMEKREGEMKTTMERLRVDASEERAKSKQLSTVIDVLNGKMEELNENVMKLEGEVKAEREKKEDMGKEMNKWQMEKEDGDGRLESAREEMEQLRITRAQLEENILSLMEDKKKGDLMREMVEKEKETLMERLKTVEMQSEQLKVTISTTCSSSEELVERLKSSVEERMKVEEEREMQKKEMEEVKKTMNEELVKARKETEEAHSTILELKELLANNEEDMMNVKSATERERSEWETTMRGLNLQLAKNEDAVRESAARLATMEKEMSAERKERSDLQAEIRLNVGDLQEKSEETFKKDTQIENLKYEKSQVMIELEKERKERYELEERIKKLEMKNGMSTGADTVDGLRGELEEERKKFDDLLAQKKQTHELFDELERNWRKKEENLVDKLNGLTDELEMLKKKTVNEQMKELRNEVDLLRSIVAERVKKEEKYKKEIEILKNMPLDGTPVRKEKKEIAPRKFCDICDVFDTHDTEDCPTQSMEPLDPSPKKTKSIPPSREYCDSCEVFGHDTSMCPNLFAPGETPKKKKDYTF